MTPAAPQPKIAAESEPPMGRRLAAIPPSGTMAVGRRVRELRAQGIDVVNLGGGVPEPAPEFLSRPIQFPADLNAGGDPAGDPKLRRAIADKLMRDQGLVYDPSAEIAVTIGAKQGLYAALLAMIDPGDEIAVLDPAWVTYAPSVAIAGGTVRTFRLDAARGFALDVRALESAIGDKTRAIVINTPHNPTGHVFTAADLEPVARVARERNLWVISDESFERFVFDGRKHFSIATLPGMRERTVVLQSFSKGYGLIGARVGYLAAPARIAAQVARFNEQVLTSVSPFAQFMAMQALAEEPQWTPKLQAHYTMKRDLTVAAVRSLSGFDCHVPEGAFYVFADVTRLGKSSDAITAEILDRARVALTPGSAFGEGGEGYVRFNLAGPVAAIREGLDRLKRVYG